MKVKGEVIGGPVIFGKEPTPRDCLGFCFDGRKGMEICSVCEGTGSTFRVAYSNVDGWRTFPNTGPGYLAAKAFLNSDRRKP